MNQKEYIREALWLIATLLFANSDGPVKEAEVFALKLDKLAAAKMLLGMEEDKEP